MPDILDSRQSPGRAEPPGQCRRLVQTAAATRAVGPAAGALVTLTCFTRVIIVLSFVRQGLATQNVPPNLVLTGLALFLTLFIMQPVLGEIDQKALQPYLAKQMTGPDAARTAIDIHKRFLLRHTRKQDLALFLHLSGNKTVQEPEQSRHS